MNRTIALLAVALLAAACASTPSPVDLKEPRRVLGTEANVRLDAQVYQDHLSESIAIPISYDVTNHRRESILIADLVPNATYDPETRAVTIQLGSEIPGENFLPRLIPVKPEEKKSFSTVAHLNIAAHPGTPWAPRPDRVLIKLSFLTDPKPFEQLVDIKEKAVYDPKLASDLFTKWVDGNETVVTNSLPMRWGSGSPDPALPPIASPLPRGGRRSDRP